MYEYRSERQATLEGLRPVNIEYNIEFYLGIRIPNTDKYDGDRLCLVSEAGQKYLTKCSGNTPHDAN